MTGQQSLSNKQRLDRALVARGLAPTRSQAEHLVRLGEVTVDGRLASKPGQMIDDTAQVQVASRERYVSRAGLKLASVSNKLGVQFQDAVVLDVGSSTGGFTDYALRHGAKRVIAVDVGTNQLHPSLRGDARIDLHEKTDIRDVRTSNRSTEISNVEIQVSNIDIILIDVSFISLRQILPHIAEHLAAPQTVIVAMVKPQFEAGRHQLTRGGIVKNDKHRRQILAEFEVWAKRQFVIRDKADSEVAGTHGNRERFYWLQLAS